MAYKKTASKKSKDAKAAENRVRAMVQESISYHTSDLARFRIKATKYYKGEPFGDEEEGRSKVVLTEVRDAVLQRMPSLMRVFFGPDGAVEYVARRPDAVDLAEQQTDYVNYLYTEQNPGFLITYGAFKDALIRRIGIIKWWWEKKKCIESERLSGLSEQELEALLTTEPDLSVLEGSTETAEDGTLTVIVRRTVERGEVRLCLVPPEEFIYNRSARTIEDAVFVAHLTEKTEGELQALGYTKDDYGDLGEDALLIPSEEKDARRPTGTSSNISQLDPATIGPNKKYSYIEAYVREDFGDGIEHKKMCFLGAKLKLVNDEPAPERPFAIFTPDPEPHEMQGLSESDMTMDLQFINSHVARGVLNSLNLSLHPRTVFNPEMVSVKDLMNYEVGGLVRTTGDPAVTVKELTHSFVGAEGLGVLEFFKGIKEERLGTTRASAGLNPDALQSSSQQAVEATVSKAEARTELMARVFAEGMKSLFKGLYNLVRRNQQEPVIVRLRGRYVEIDPRMWPSDPDVSARVGIGGGTRQEKLEFLQATAEKQEAVMQLLGPVNALTDVKRYRNTLAEQSRIMGYDPTRSWKEITDEQVQEMEAGAAAPPATEDPAAMLAQAQVENEGLRLQNDQLKAQTDAEVKMAEIALKREEMMRKDDLERDKLEADIFLRAKEIELKYAAQVDTTRLKGEIERDRERIKADAAITTSAMSSVAEPTETLE